MTDSRLLCINHVSSFGRWTRLRSSKGGGSRLWDSLLHLDLVFGSRFLVPSFGSGDSFLAFFWAASAAFASVPIVTDRKLSENVTLRTAEDEVSWSQH